MGNCSNYDYSCGYGGDGGYYTVDVAYRPDVPNPPDSGGVVIVDAYPPLGGAGGSATGRGGDGGSIPSSGGADGGRDAIIIPGAGGSGGSIPSSGGSGGGGTPGSGGRGGTVTIPGGTGGSGGNRDAGADAAGTGFHKPGCSCEVGQVNRADADLSMPLLIAGVALLLVRKRRRVVSR